MWQDTTCETRGIVAGGGQGAIPLKLFGNRRIFGNVDASSENFQTFVVSKDKGFEVHRTIIELGSPSPYSTGETAFEFKSMQSKGCYKLKN